MIFTLSTFSFGKCTVSMETFSKYHIWKSQLNKNSISSYIVTIRGDTNHHNYHQPQQQQISNNSNTCFICFNCMNPVLEIKDQYF